MTTDKKELAVAALRNGTVIDRIPSPALFKAVELLGIAGMDTNVTIGNNLDSKKIGKKGIIKVADVSATSTLPPNAPWSFPTALWALYAAETQNASATTSRCSPSSM